MNPARRALSVSSDATSADPSESEDLGDKLVATVLCELANWAAAAGERNEVSLYFGFSLFFYSWHLVPLSPKGRINRKTPME